jgi:PAS domain S-box-containing protein
MISASASLSGSYDYFEVTRSLLVAIAASYAGLDLAQRTTSTTGRVRLKWLSGGAAAIGVCIWAVQFKGMLAFMPSPVEYRWPRILASLVLSILAIAITLHVVSRRRMGSVEALTGAAILSGGVAGVHYIFIFTLKSPPVAHFSPLLVALSILLPILFSWVALLMAFAPRKDGGWPIRVRLGSAAIMGIGLAAMRYTSMAAIGFVPASPANFPHATSISELGDNGGAIAALIIIAVAIVTSSVDRKADAKVQRLNQELENRVADRTAQITAVNTRLAESEERFRKLVEALPDAILVHGKNEILFVNPSCMKLLGAQRPEQLLGQDVLKFLHPDYKEAVQQCIQYCLDTGTACPAKESVFLALDGSEVPIEAAAIAIPWNGSQAVEVTIRDIRQRKCAEERLREYEKVVEGSEELIVVVNREYRYVLANRAFLNRRGVEKEQLLGRLVPEVVNEEVFTTLVKEKLDECFRGKVVRFELKYTYPDLGERDYFASWLPIEGPNGIDRAACVLQDITERKRGEEALRQSEERFHLAAQAGKMFAYEWDAATDLIVRSRESSQILGIDEADPVTAQQMLARVHPDDQERLRAAVARLNPELPHLHVSYRMARPDGSVIWVERSSRAHFAEDGRLLRMVGMVTDVTERKHAEQSLQLFRTLIDQSNDAIEVVDPDTLRYIDINERACIDLGYTREELLSMSVYAIDPNVDQSMFARVHQEIRQTGSTIFESIHRRKDGSTFPVEVSVKDAHFDRIYLVSVARDITERKRVEDELRKQKEVFQKIFENIPVMIAFFGEDGRFKLANPEWERTTGWKVEEIQKQNLDIFVELYPDPQYRQVARDFASSSNGAHADLKVRVRDGRVIDMAADVVHLSDGSRLGIGKDITEQKRTEAELRESEARFRLVADSAPVMIWMADPDKLCTYFNKPWLEFTGRSIARELGNGWAEGVHPADFQKCLDTYIQSFDRREAFRMEYRLRRHDGEFRCLLDSGVPRFNPDRSFAGYIGSCIDVTDQKRAEEQLRQAQADLARVTRVVAMGELVASIAHEINQPLAAVVTNGSASLRWLAAQPPNLEEAGEAIEAAIQEATRASDVIGRIRALLQKSPTQMQRLDLNTVIREVLILAETELRRGGVTVQTELAAGLPAVLGDPIQLRQVMLNLILNAIDAMSAITDRPHEVFIKSAARPDGALVQVQDSGPGVDPLHIDRIFDSLFTTKPQGIGVGLSLSRSIVEAHGGRLWVASGDRNGALFQFTVPQAD